MRSPTIIPVLVVILCFGLINNMQARIRNV